MTSANIKRRPTKSLNLHAGIESKKRALPTWTFVNGQIFGWAKLEIHLQAVSIHSPLNQFRRSLSEWALHEVNVRRIVR
jgi:hypothetical protein